MYDTFRWRRFHHIGEDSREKEEEEEDEEKHPTLFILFRLLYTPFCYVLSNAVYDY